jgi:hypothetical protein
VADLVDHSKGRALGLINAVLVFLYFGCGQQSTPDLPNPQLGVAASAFSDLISKGKVDVNVRYLFRSAVMPRDARFKPFQSSIHSILGIVNDSDTIIIIETYPNEYQCFLRTTVTKIRNSPRNKVIDRDRFRIICSALGLNDQDVHQPTKLISLEQLSLQRGKELATFRSKQALICYEPTFKLFLHWGDSGAAFSEILPID